MQVLFLFLDGVGLGSPEPSINPLAWIAMPTLQELLEGQRLLRDSAPLDTRQASLVALDACLGVEGLPQSATGQAAILTGRNVPAELGYHYGPKPNRAIADYLVNGNLFKTLSQTGHRAVLLNAYPPSYFQAIASGRASYSAIPLAATVAGLRLKDSTDLYSGQALSADFTGRGWREHLGLADAPLLEPIEAGRRLAALATDYDLTFFEYWLSDYIGHYRDMDAACTFLTLFDQVLQGLLTAWDGNRGLILITSDHGNLEDLSTRTHTTNPVPALVIGAPELRRPFVRNLRDLSDIAPAVFSLISQPPANSANEVRSGPVSDSRRVGNLLSPLESTARPEEQPALSGYPSPSHQDG